MNTQRRPSLSPVLWARILARYGELGRPLTDAELQGIVSNADTKAGDFSFTREFASGRLVIDAGLPSQPELVHRPATDLVADECESFDSIPSAKHVAIVSGVDVQTDGLHFATGVVHSTRPPAADIVFDDLLAEELAPAGAEDPVARQKVGNRIVCWWQDNEITMTPQLWARVWGLYKSIGRTLTREELFELVDIDGDHEI